MNWLDEKRVEYGKVKRELKIISSVEMVFLYVSLIAEFGMVAGFIWSPMVFAVSVAVLSIALPIVVGLSIRSNNVRSQYASLKQTLRIDD